MKCAKCKRKIPKERLKALPDTKTCVKCSDVQAVYGLLDSTSVNHMEVESTHVFIIDPNKR